MIDFFRGLDLFRSGLHQDGPLINLFSRREKSICQTKKRRLCLPAI